jgi:PASTA domain
MATDTGGNVQVDRIWGNMPMQPNDQRLNDANSTDVLDEDLGDHIIATTAYNGFPDYTPESPYLDVTPNVEVPDVLGDLTAAAQAAIEAEGLVFATGTAVNNAGGATAINDNQAASQLPAAGTVVNEGSTVTVRFYDYTP